MKFSDYVCRMCCNQNAYLVKTEHKNWKILNNLSIHLWFLLLLPDTMKHLKERCNKFFPEHPAYRINYDFMMLRSAL